MRASIVLVAVLLPLWTSLAGAQHQLTADPGQSPPPAATPTYPALNSQPFGAEHLLGGGWGSGSWFESHGIDVGFDYFSETAAIVSGGQREERRGVGRECGVAEVDRAPHYPALRRCSRGGQHV